MTKTVILLLGLFSFAMLFALEQQPLLMLNTEMHSQRIGSLALDKSEKLLLTCSTDKTARVWDVDSGELLRILRPPIDKNSEGKMFAGALSPDGRRAVIGGWTNDTNSLYLFDVATGALIGQIGVLPDITLDIEFSPDGRYLAAGQGADYGVRVFRCSDWKEIAKLEGYGASTYRIAFDRLGRLATACWDGKVRLYDSTFRLLRERDFGSESQPYSLAFDPAGKKLAVAFNNRRQVDVLDAKTLNKLYQPESPIDLLDGILVSVCFSADGSLLYGGGSFQYTDRQPRSFVLRTWQDAGAGAWSDQTLSRNIILDLKPLADKSLLYCSSFPDWGRVAADGNEIVYREPDLQSLAGAAWASLKVSFDGLSLGFTSQQHGAQTFDLAQRSLRSQALDAPAYVDSAAGMDLLWLGTDTPILNGRYLNFLAENERNYCADIAEEQGKILMGADWRIYCLDEEGNKIWKTPMQPATLAVKASGNGLYAVAYVSDGTFRWYRMSDGALLLSLFVHRDCQRWVLYTPRGFYDCAPGSEELIGWHLNRGYSQEAILYPVAQFRNSYYRPDIIDKTMALLDESEAIRVANMELHITEGAKGISGILPPAVRITAPAHNSTFSNSTIDLRYSIANLNNDPVTSLKVLLDGRPYKVLKDLNTLETEGSISLQLPSRTCRVGLIAENKHGKSEMDDIKLVWLGTATVQVDAPLPRLYILAVGIADYQLEGYDLRYAAKDADDFSTVLSAQDGLLYSAVEVKMLTNAQASRDSIRSGLQWLRSSCREGDVAMIFLSGHGANDPVGSFYYLPVAADIERLDGTCIPFGDFESVLSAIPGKVLFFVDACHSGSIHTATGQRAPDIARLVNTLSSDDVGVVVFTSSTSRQVSYEDEGWLNGAFTKALVEALTGSADYVKSGSISLKELDLYISTRVKELAEQIGKYQTPTTIIPQSIPDFNIVKLAEKQ